MYSLNEYNILASKYGTYSSWAIWNPQNPTDTTIIDKYVDQLHSKFVVLGLNISRPLVNKPTWSNFHGKTHDRKLNYACNDTILRGSYITDIFKGIVNPNSTNFLKYLTKEQIEGNVNVFNQEMADIRINSDTKFIVLGTPNSILAKCFNSYFKQNYKNPIVHYYHYSYFTLTDKEWVTGLWGKLYIDQNKQK